MSPPSPPRPDEDHLAWAMAYGQAGYPVLPLWGKRPALRSERPIASVRQEFIRASWDGRQRGANIGIETGAASGLLVLDINADRGGWETLTLVSFVEATDEWRSFESFYRWVKLRKRKGIFAVNPPPCLSVRTGRGNLHCYFALPPGWPPGYGGGEIGPGLDLRCDGDYVVAPPSIHPNQFHPNKWMRQGGCSRGRYLWHPDRSLLTQPLPPAPGWSLAQLLRLNPGGPGSSR